MSGRIGHLAHERPRQRITVFAASCAAALRYFSFFDAAETGTITLTNRFAPGRAFRVIGYGVRCQAAPGSTLVSLHRNGSGTPEESVTVDPGGTMTWIRAETSADYSETDDLSLAITATVYPADVHGYVDIVWM